MPWYDFQISLLFLKNIIELFTSRNLLHLYNAETEWKSWELPGIWWKNQSLRIRNRDVFCRSSESDGFRLRL